MHPHAMQGLLEWRLLPHPVCAHRHRNDTSGSAGLYCEEPRQYHYRATFDATAIRVEGMTVGFGSWAV